MGICRGEWCLKGYLELILFSINFQCHAYLLSLLFLPRRPLRVLNLSHFRKQRYPNTISSYLDILSSHDRYYPIYVFLTTYLGIAEVLALTETCKKPCGLHKQLLMSHWNVDRDLKSFIEKPFKVSRTTGTM